MQESHDHENDVLSLFNESPLSRLLRKDPSQRNVLLSAEAAAEFRKKLKEMEEIIRAQEAQP